MIVFSKIGQAVTEFESVEGMPLQGSGISESCGQIVLSDEYADGLKDIEGFSHLYVLFHLHRCHGKSRLKVMPFLDTKERGVFATRSPKRPNPLGLSIVELIRRDGRTLYVRGLDLLNGTPVIDIKPYIQSFDNIQGTRDGWYIQGRDPQQMVSDERFK
ncbi:MAG: hypothetical protein CENE_01501 [Candidatus Celerinatantimonas neptuna]|nr:MAG: hypothetical protein CENE_01501 [Candidatus Celerinatantimonas neptuna]